MEGGGEGSEGCEPAGEGGVGCGGGGGGGRRCCLEAVIGSSALGVSDDDDWIEKKERIEVGMGRGGGERKEECTHRVLRRGCRRRTKGRTVRYRRPNGIGLVRHKHRR